MTRGSSFVQMRIVRIMACEGEGAVGAASAAKLMDSQIAAWMITADVPVSRLTPLLQPADHRESTEASNALPPFAEGEGRAGEG